MRLSAIVDTRPYTRESPPPPQTWSPVTPSNNAKGLTLMGVKESQTLRTSISILIIHTNHVRLAVRRAKDYMIMWITVVALGLSVARSGPSR